MRQLWWFLVLLTPYCWGQKVVHFDCKMLLHKAIDNSVRQISLSDRKAIFGRYRMTFVPAQPSKPVKTVEVESLRSASAMHYKTAEFEYYQDKKLCMSIVRPARLITIGKVDNSKPLQASVVEELAESQMNFFGHSLVSTCKDTLWKGKMCKSIVLLPYPRSSMAARFSSIIYLIEPGTKTLVAQKMTYLPGGKTRYYWIEYLAQERRKLPKNFSVRQIIYNPDHSTRTEFKAYKIEDLSNSSKL